MLVGNLKLRKITGNTNGRKNQVYEKNDSCFDRSRKRVVWHRPEF
jgi:hypothetical protein